jgi:hypothetical protein
MVREIMPPGEATNPRQAEFARKFQALEARDGAEASRPQRHIRRIEAIICANNITLFQAALRSFRSRTTSLSADRVIE